MLKGAESCNRDCSCLDLSIISVSHYVGNKLVYNECPLLFSELITLFHNWYRPHVRTFHEFMNLTVKSAINCYITCIGFPVLLLWLELPLSVGAPENK